MRSKPLKPYVDVELVGILQKAAGTRKVRLDIRKDLEVIDLVKKLIKLYGESLATALFNPVSTDPRTNSLILINGREITTLRGLKTLVTAGDHVVLLPISHGG